MTPLELRSSLGLASVSGLRLLGLFIILPVFALYAETLAGGDNRVLVGLALGAYGLTQAVLQIPFGWLSDRWGRKPTIYLGLAIFAIGSFVAAMADSIHLVILGRVIQGAGAISAAVIALLADLTREEVRTKAMALIGITIGVSFTVSMGGGPLLAHWIGVPGVFVLTGLLALGAALLVRIAIPDPPVHVAARPRGRFADVLADGQLLRLDIGVFALHAALMALFVVVPFSLRSGGLDSAAQWKVYLPVMFLSFVLMAPGIAISERRGWQKPAFLGSIGFIAASFVILAAAQSNLTLLTAGLSVFFVGFNFLEASLPSLISRVAPVAAKGTAAGVYSSLQFLGTFVGAAVAGWLSQHWGPTAVFGFCGALIVVWFFAALGMSVPVLRTYPVAGLDPASADRLVGRLRSLPGVREANIALKDSVARLKVDRARFDEQNALRLLEGKI